MQNAVSVRRRATATAVLFLFLNLIALGGGPPFTGWVIDQLAGVRFGGGGEDSVWSLVTAWAGGGPGDAPSFASSCPGGIAPAGATPALTDSCRVALADGTRGGLVLTFLFYGWASVHYFLAAIGMGRHLRVRT